MSSCSNCGTGVEAGDLYCPHCGTALQEPMEKRKEMTIGEALFTFQGRMSLRDYWLKGFIILLPIAIINNFCYYLG